MIKGIPFYFCLLLMFVFPPARASANPQKWQSSWPEFCKTITEMYAKGANEEDFKFLEGQDVSWQGGNILEVSTGGEFEDFIIYVDMPKCSVKRPDGSSADASSLTIAYQDEESLRNALKQIGISDPEHFNPLKDVRVSARLKTGSNAKGVKYKSPIRWVSGKEATGEPYAFIQIQFAPGAMVLTH